MADTSNPNAGAPGSGASGATGAAGAGAGDASGQQQAPRLAIVSQYVKDLSFENPRAPASLQPGGSRPEIQVRVDVRAQQIEGGERYECMLKLDVDAKTPEGQMFMVELSYGGTFALSNIPQESLHALLLIECPRLLFPFARRIVADATRDGGFPPLMIEPIDFVALYRRRAQQEQAQQAAGGAQPLPGGTPQAGGTPQGGTPQGGTPRPN